MLTVGVPDAGAATQQPLATYDPFVITVIDYDPRWPDRFEALREKYAGAMIVAGVHVVAIEHVGSTSVPGLAAKPIIDCDIVVGAPDVAAASAVLVSLGFHATGRALVSLSAGRSRNPTGSPAPIPTSSWKRCLSLRNHLSLRDTLRVDDAAAG